MKRDVRQNNTKRFKSQIVVKRLGNKQKKPSKLLLKNLRNKLAKIAVGVTNFQKRCKSFENTSQQYLCTRLVSKTSDWCQHLKKHDVVFTLTNIPTRLHKAIAEN